MADDSALPSLPRRPVDQIAKPLRDLLEVQSASGILLLIATAAALLVANFGDYDAWHHFWETPLGVSLGEASFSLSLHAWINDGLMAIFFFVVGLEIKREVVTGELSSWQEASLPVVAALGGALVPALVYLVLPAGSAHPSGWAVPMATDIAFVVGVLALIGDRVPSTLRVLMLTVAIVDDLLAVVVIAAFYSEGVAAGWLAGALGALALQVGLVMVGARSRLLFVPVALAVWFCTLKAGIHPTVAGVALALTIPLRPQVPPRQAAGAVARARQLVEDDDVGEHYTQAALVQIRRFASRSVPPLERLEGRLAPWSNFVIMPLFALSNAGVQLAPDLLVHPVTVAVALGLLAGKPVGMLGATFAAVRGGLAQRPPGITWRHLAGGGALAGIGFTMSLFIANLGLDGGALTAARTGILLGSAAAAGLGAAVLLIGGTDDNDAQ